MHDGKGSDEERSKSCFSMQKPIGVADGPYPGEYTESKMTALK